jgi:hypothetical protein
VEAPLDLSVKFGRIGGWRQAASSTFEQREVDFRLQVADQTTNGGLTNPHQLSANSHAAGLIDGPKRFDLTKVEPKGHVDLSIIFSYATMHNLHWTLLKD